MSFEPTRFGRDGWNCAYQAYESNRAETLAKTEAALRSECPYATPCNVTAWIQGYLDYCRPGLRHQRAYVRLGGKPKHESLIGSKAEPPFLSPNPKPRPIDFYTIDAKVRVMAVDKDEAKRLVEAILNKQIMEKGNRSWRWVERNELGN